MSASEPAAPGVFTFHVKNEPKSLDPKFLTSGTSNYIVNNLYRGLTRVNDEEILVFDQAKKCRYQGNERVVCQLRKMKWSDGKDVTAKDYVASFKDYLSKDSRCPCLDLLFSIKNAKKIYQGELSSDQFGMKATGDLEITFDFEGPDREFLEKLSNPLLVPYRPPLKPGDWSSLPVNGPYKIKEWIPNQHILFTKNDQFEGGNPVRPDVKIVFAPEDSSALTLYEKGVLNFLWRVPTEYIPKFKSRPDFVQIPVARFDYIGFKLDPKSPFADKNVREAFVKSLDFDEFQKLLSARGRPGCTGLGDELLDSEETFCLKQDLDRVKQIRKQTTLPKSVEFYFSKLGGDDHRRSAEWLQSQWSKNLGVKVNVKSIEQKVFLSRLREPGIYFFRKGVGLDRPTCLAGIEIFRKDHPENFVGFNDPQFEIIAKGLAQQKLSRAEKSSLCGAAIKLLFHENYVGIPLGRIHFTMLARPEFKGWTINSLNQLDLSGLARVPNIK